MNNYFQVILVSTLQVGFLSGNVFTLSAEVLVYTVSEDVLVSKRHTVGVSN